MWVKGKWELYLNKIYESAKLTPKLGVAQYLEVAPR